MAINARLAAELETLLNEYCERTRNSKSEVLREALMKHLRVHKNSKPPSLYSLAADLIPGEGLSASQSRDIKRIMNKHWRGKRAT